MKINLGNKTYNLELTIKNLKDFGMLPSKIDENTVKLSEIIAGLKMGDIFTLIDVLSNLLAKDNLDLDAVEKALQKTNNVDSLFDKLIDFFKTAPFTSRMMKRIMPTLDQALQKLDNKKE